MQLWRDMPSTRSSADCQRVSVWVSQAQSWKESAVPTEGRHMQRTLIQGCRGSDFNARVLGGRVSLQCLGARGQGMVLQEMTAWLGMKNTEELDVQ